MLTADEPMLLRSKELSSLGRVFIKSQFDASSSCTELSGTVFDFNDFPVLAGSREHAPSRPTGGWKDDDVHILDPDGGSGGQFGAKLVPEESKMVPEEIDLEDKIGLI